MSRFLAAAIVSIPIAGCVSGPAIDYIRQEYTGTSVVLHKTDVDEYRIFDKPEAGKLMITPSLARASGIGVVHGATYGADSYLRSTGRTCRITSTELLANPQYEVKYDCSTGTAPAAARRR